MVLSLLSITVTSRICVLIDDMSLVNLMLGWVLFNVDMNSVSLSCP